MFLKIKIVLLLSVLTLLISFGCVNKSQNLIDNSLQKYIQKETKLYQDNNLELQILQFFNERINQYVFVGDPYMQGILPLYLTIKNKTNKPIQISNSNICIHFYHKKNILKPLSNYELKHFKWKMYRNKEVPDEFVDGFTSIKENIGKTIIQFTSFFNNNFYHKLYYQFGTIKPNSTQKGLVLFHFDETHELDTLLHNKNKIPLSLIIGNQFYPIEFDKKIVNYPHSAINKMSTNKLSCSDCMYYSLGFNTHNYYALLIGINNYVNWKHIKSPINDVKGVSSILAQKYGFEVSILIDEDASRNRILNSLNYYRKKLKPGDLFLIYFAGHGYYDMMSRKGYWIPYDAEKNSDLKWISSDDISIQLKHILATSVLVISDSCYSGTLAKQHHIIDSKEIERKAYLKNMISNRSRILISSGGKEPVLDTGGRGHSIFATSFIDSLNDMKESIFSSKELFDYKIKEMVAGSVTQIPEYHIIQNAGHNNGDFVFVKWKKNNK